jgi:hypothetical protein
MGVLPVIKTVITINKWCALRSEALLCAVGTNAVDTNNNHHTV